jgi:hypothetical protein
MLRTCSLPDLYKLFKTIEDSPESSHIRYSLDLPYSPTSQEGDEEETEEEEGSEENSDSDDM